MLKLGIKQYIAPRRVITAETASPDVERPQWLSLVHDIDMSCYGVRNRRALFNLCCSRAKTDGDVYCDCVTYGRETRAYAVRYTASVERMRLVLHGRCSD